MKRLLWLCLLLFVAVTTSQAQTQSTCAQTLRLAQSIYDQGRLHELPSLLSTCLEGDNFTDDEKVRAYKLLALTYIYLEEPQKADEMMLSLLRTHTEFKVNDAVDPAEFVALYKTFRTNPIYRIGGKLAAVAAAPSVITSDFVNDGTNKYEFNFGFRAAVAAEVPVGARTRRFTLNPELGIELISFDATNLGADPVKVTEGHETQLWVSLPVSMQYSLYERSITNFYIAGGLSADYRLSSSIRIFSDRGDDNSTVSENKYPIDEQRKRFNSALLLSAGYKRKVGNGYLVAEVRYKLGLMPALTKADVYENSTLVFDYQYVDGIFRINSLSMSVGYIINRYNPKKLKVR